MFWSSEAGENLELLANQRRHATNVAACQRLGHRLYLSKTSSPSILNSASLQHPSVLKETCPWLPLSKTRNEMPYYLWDSTIGTTVVAHELPTRSDYSCVSHTWGRWRLAGTAAIKGVSEWEIPRNSVFEVTELPEILALCADRLSTRHVWFDLVCIPQEGLARPELTELARREISRRALIFRNASSCAAWLNYVDNWTTEVSTLECLALTYLRLSTPSGHYETDELFAKAREDANHLLQLIVHPSHNRYLGASTFPLPKSDFLPRLFRVAKFRLMSQQDLDRPSAWFSSLWTLQEAYLRPDMILMDRECNRLSDSAGNIFTLEAVATLMKTVQYLLRSKPIGATYYPQVKENIPEAKLPLGPSQLNNLFANTQLISGTHSPLAHIIVQVNWRQCTGRRAEAIMSVLGVTEWFTEPASRDDLVLGMYPVSFVNEAIRKIGPEFFLSKKPTGRPFTFLSYFLGSMRGSLLPFEPLDHTSLRGRRPLKMSHYQVYDPRFHPSVSSWSLLPSGSFKIARAAILASSLNPHPDGVVPVSVVLLYQSTRGRYIHHTLMPIYEFVSSQPKHYLTFAVNISRDLGVILRGFVSREQRHSDL